MELQEQRETAIEMAVRWRARQVHPVAHHLQSEVGARILNLTPENLPEI